MFETAGFSAKVYPCALSQHCANTFFVQCYLRHIWTTLTRQCSQAMFFQLGQHNIVQVIFLIKVVSQPWANIPQAISLCNVGPDRPRQIVDYFSARSCLWTVGQHYTGKFLEQCWHRQIRQHCISCFPAKTCLRALGQHCTSNVLVQCYLRRILTILTRQYFYPMLPQHGRYNIVQVIFLIKVVCLPWANIAQVIFLCNVGPERSGHYCRLFSSAKLFMDCAMIGG